MRIAWLCMLAACGDNRLVPDAPVPPDSSLACRPAPGSVPTLQRILIDCAAADAPAYPNCGDGGIVFVASPPNDPRRFIVEQQGRIRIMLPDGTMRLEPFLDIVTTADPPLVAISELGLLGLAFHPQFATTGELFIYYTSPIRDVDPVNPYRDIVMRYTIGPDPDRVDPDSGTVVMAIEDFGGNHNGGMLEFGPDGYLYLAPGDGGFQNDPLLAGQDPNALLGKILRIDVDARGGGKEYGIPADNPFASGGGAPEVFMLGTRNPWRFSFDRETADLWVADVGQNEIEELTMIPRDRQRGANLGWSMYEGTRCFHPPCEPLDQTFPQFEGDHADGWCSIIGGAVYRGSCFPGLTGRFFFGDYCRRGLYSAEPLPDGTLRVTQHTDDFPREPFSFSGDAQGELYVSDSRNNLYRIEAKP